MPLRCVRCVPGNFDVEAHGKQRKSRRREAILFAVAALTSVVALILQLSEAASTGLLSVYVKGKGSNVVSRAIDPARFDFEFNLTIGAIILFTLLGVLSIWYAAKGYAVVLHKKGQGSGNAL